MDEKNNGKFVSGKDSFERLVQLETLVKTDIEHRKEALILARDIEEREKNLAKDELSVHLLGLNNARERMDKLEATLATKPELANEVRLINLSIKSENNVAIGKAEAVEKLLDSKLEGIRKEISDAKILSDAKFDGIRKLVYIGVGFATALGFLVKFIHI